MPYGFSTSGWESTSSGRLQQSSHICVLKEILKLWSNTEGRLDGLLKRPDGCKMEQFEASRHRGRPGWKVLVVRMDDAVDCRSSKWFDTSSGRMVLWIVWRPDCMTRCLDGKQGTGFSELWSVQNFLEALWIVESLLKSIITKKWFCSTECGQLQTNKLPIWSFWDKNHLTG
jgi:hypothetical protein